MSKELIPALFAVSMVCLSGCALTKNQNESSKASLTDAPSVSKIDDVKTSSVSIAAASSHLTQCNRDLESLRTVSMTEYKRYQSEYDALIKSSTSFMTVKDDVSPEVAELARPKFQFALVNLCYRIKDALAQTLINQAGGR